MKNKSSENTSDGKSSEKYADTIRACTTQARETDTYEQAFSVRN